MATGGDVTSMIDRLGGSLVNAVLGGLILWVGQTAVRHEGVLAGIDEKLASVDLQFTDVEKRYDSLKKWLELAVNELKDSNRNNFTMKDGDKLTNQVRQSDQAAVELERRFQERLAAIDLKIASLESQARGMQDVSALQQQVAYLRAEVAGATMAARQTQYAVPDRVVQGPPVFLPPVDNRR